MKIAHDANGRNQLTKYKKNSSITNYYYYPSGLRSQKTTGTDTTKFIYSGDEIVYETRPSGVSMTYTYGLDLINETYVKNYTTELNYCLHNGHGDVIQLSNYNATSTSSYKYDAFGMLLSYSRV